MTDDKLFGKKTEAKSVPCDEACRLYGEYVYLNTLDLAAHKVSEETMNALAAYYDHKKFCGKCNSLPRNGVK